MLYSVSEYLNSFRFLRIRFLFLITTKNIRVPLFTNFTCNIYVNFILAVAAKFKLYKNEILKMQ